MTKFTKCPAQSGQHIPPSMKTKVEIIESERGWGQKLVEVMEFDTRALAEAYVVEFNASNNLPKVPDWYMYARIKE